MNKRVEAKRIIKKVKIVKAPRKTDKPTGQIPLTNNLDNLHKLTEAHFARSGNASPDVKKEIELSAKERREAGRYTLEEAAFYVGYNTTARTESILEGLEEAVKNRLLSVYAPGRIGKYKSDVVRPWYEESFWNDLNEWLGKNEPRIGRIFPNPNIVVAKVKNTDQSDQDWIIESIKIADREGNKRWASGYRQITARNICNKVAIELGKNTKFWGNRGERVGDTIRNTALKGWKFIPPKSGTNGTSGTKE